MISVNDNILSPNTKLMAETLGSFMHASSQLITDKFINKDTYGSNWQKYMNSFGLEIDILNEIFNNELNVGLDRPNSIHNTYIAQLESEINVIDSIDGLIKSEYIFDFLLGAPVLDTFVSTNTTDFNLTHTVCDDYNGNLRINYVSVDDVEVDYICMNYNMIRLYSSAGLNSIVKVSYRTNDTYYHDAKNYMVYFKNYLENININANNKVYTVTENKYKKFWNNLDSIGLLFDNPRLNDEPDELYRERIRDSFIFEPTQTCVGIRNIAARRLDLIKHETWINDRFVYNILDAHRDSIRIDYKPVDYHQFEFLGLSIIDEIVENSLRVFRNGLLLHECEMDINGNYIDSTADDYRLLHDCVVFNRPIQFEDNICMDYLIKDGTYKKMSVFVPDMYMIDGSNKVITLPETQLVGKTQVYHNGLRDSAGVDYNEDPGSIEFRYAPKSGDNVVIYYITDEENAHYEYHRILLDEDSDGNTLTYELPERTDKLYLFVNGVYKHHQKDYTFTDETHIELLQYPEEHSRIDACYIRFNSNKTEGANYECINFQMMVDGSFKWNIGSLNPDTSYRNLKLKMKYHGGRNLKFEDIWMTAYIRSDTEYASDDTYCNSLEYQYDKYRNITNETTNYTHTIEPKRDGWVTTTIETPDTPAGYIPLHPILEITETKKNIDRIDENLIVSNNEIEYLYKVRNTGDKIADNVSVVISPPPYYTVVDNGCGNYTIICETKRGLSHDVRYIKTNKWNTNVSDSINIFPIWDEEIAPRILFDENGLPTQQLISFVDKINNEIPTLWDNGTWDKSLWDSFVNCYGDINTKKLYTLYTLWQAVESVDAIRTNYSFVPHKWDATFDNLYTTSVDGIDRRFDVQSGIGYGDDLKLSVNTEEYKLFAGNRHYMYPVYVKNGRFYLNEIPGYQYSTPGIYQVSSLGTNNSVNFSCNKPFLVLISSAGNLYKCRKTLFFTPAGERTHTYTETVRGNGINNKLFLSFKLLDIDKVTHVGTNLEITNYSVYDSSISVEPFQPGVTKNTYNEYVIDNTEEYEIEYQLINSYYYDDINGKLYFKEDYENIIIFYEADDEVDYNTNILANPLYSPHSKKFIYGDIEKPTIEYIESWVSPNMVRSSDDIIFITAECKSKYGTPIKDVDVIITSSTGVSETRKTNEFGRVVYVYRTNVVATGECTFTFTAGDKMSTAKFYIYS